MRRVLVLVLPALLAGCVGTFAQSEGGAGIKSSREVEIPTLKSVKESQLATHKEAPHSGFLKNLTIDSFGFDASPTGQGFESPTRFTNTPMLSSGLECPRCIMRPAMERSRFTLPPFGAQATLPLWHDRAEIFTGFGGINAWKPDNTLIEPGRRGTSFNNAWLVQGDAGARFAVDHDRRLWLGPIGRYVRNLGEGKKHWNTFGGTATLQLGR